MPTSRRKLHPPQATPTASVYPYVADSRFGRLLQRLAGAKVPVLFAGGKGTGKRWLGRSLYALSAARGPLVEIPVDGLVASPGDRRAEVELLENAMQQAAGGCLLITDAGSLSVLGQAAVVELIARPRTDVRVIACVHAAVKGLDDAGLRRQFIDSFLHVDLLPLYERRLELPAIIDLFVSCRAEAARRPVPQVSVDVIDRLGRRGWPTRLEQIERFAAHVVLRGDARRASRGAMAGGDAATDDVGQSRLLRSASANYEAPSNVLTFVQRKTFSQINGNAVPRPAGTAGRLRSRFEEESS